MDLEPEMRLTECVNLSLNDLVPLVASSLKLSSELKTLSSASALTNAYFCGVCQTQYEQVDSSTLKESVTLQPCSHKICKSCIAQWVATEAETRLRSRRPCCPLCKQLAVMWIDTQTNFDVLDLEACRLRTGLALTFTVVELIAKKLPIPPHSPERVHFIHDRIKSSEPCMLRIQQAMTRSSEPLDAYDFWCLAGELYTHTSAEDHQAFIRCHDRVHIREPDTAIHCGVKRCRVEPESSNEERADPLESATFPSSQHVPTTSTSTTELVACTVAAAAPTTTSTTLNAGLAPASKRVRQQSPMRRSAFQHARTKLKTWSSGRARRRQYG